jgi:hypothetical protein
MASRIFPSNFLPTANYHKCLGVTIESLIAKRKSKLPTKMAQRYAAECSGAFRTVYEFLRVCRGEQHPLTAEAKRVYAESKSK